MESAFSSFCNHIRKRVVLLMLVVEQIPQIDYSVKVPLLSKWRCSWKDWPLLLNEHSKPSLDGLHMFTSKGHFKAALLLCYLWESIQEGMEDEQHQWLAASWGVPHSESYESGCGSFKKCSFSRTPWLRNQGLCFRCSSNSFQLKAHDASLSALSY